MNMFTFQPQLSSESYSRKYDNIPDMIIIIWRIFMFAFLFCCCYFFLLSFLVSNEILCHEMVSVFLPIIFPYSILNILQSLTLWPYVLVSEIVGPFDEMTSLRKMTSNEPHQNTSYLGGVSLAYKTLKSISVSNSLSMMYIVENFCHRGQGVYEGSALAVLYIYHIFAK